ncbi:MAG: VWA domain-containing protein, partial [Gammaproteobacteria bacterium]
MDSIVQFFTHFHWLRPLWLLALPINLLVFWLNQKQSIPNSSWQHLIAPHLAKHLLVGANDFQRTPRLSLPMAWLIISSLSTLALAGPAWRQLPQPTERQVDAVVIVLDLSLSMSAEDVTPSRIARARFKVKDMLDARHEGLTGLVVYAGNAHTVVPLTEDTGTIAALLPALSPWLMPVKGNRPDLAIEQALRVLNQSERTLEPIAGHIILISDELTPNDAPRIKALLANTPHRLSILGMGTANGAPIALPNGQFLHDDTGQLVLPKTDFDAMAAFARATNSDFIAFTASNEDVARVLKTPFWDQAAPSEVLDSTFDIWQDEGFWLIWLSLPVTLLLFRRGYATVLLLGLFVGSASWPETASAGLWQSLWQTPDQRAARAMEEGQYAEAAEQFTTPRWSAAAAYRNQDFQGAIERL